MILGSWLFRLKILTFAVVPGCLLVSLHFLLYSKIHGIALNPSELGLWVVAIGLICFPIGQWIADGKLWALKLISVVGLLWLGVSAVLAISSRSFSLGFFSLFVALHWIALRALLTSVVTKSFFDPMVSWFQSRPRAISGLKAQVKVGENTFSAQVGRLDRTGTFLFVESGEARPMSKGFLKKLRKHPIQIDFDSSLGSARCKGSPIRVLTEEGGIGFRFQRHSADESKRLGDLIEHLEGSGYV